MPGDALDVFISYSQEDEILRRELEEQLMRLKSEGLVDTWHERRIIAGEDWRGWIDRDLMSADLILLIVSAPFLESGYCRDSEIKHALELHAARHARVLPIIARPCDWLAEPFGELATLPRDVGPVTEWHDRDDAWQEVAQGIREIATRLRAARLESTGEFRKAAPDTARQADRLDAARPKRVSGFERPRWTLLAGWAAALAAAAAVLFLIVWLPQRLADASAPFRAADLSPAGSESGPRDEPRPTAESSVEPPPAPRAARPPGVAPEAAASAPEEEEEVQPVETETPPEAAPPAASETEAGADDSAGASAAADASSPPAAAARAPEDLERSLGILASPGAESEGECLAVLIADEYALTSRACARESAVVVMGGNALTATRDEIFDLEPRQSPQPAAVNVVKLLQGLGDTYGFASTRLENSFEIGSLTAHYVAAATIHRVECQAAARLVEVDGDSRAYVEDAAFDRYARFVEEAADESIAIAGAGWATLFAEVVGSAEESLAGFVCDLPRAPAGNLVFSVEGRVAGIGYACEPFDRLEPEVRDSLPPEIRQLDLDCLGSLGEIAERLRAAQGEDAQADVAPR